MTKLDPTVLKRLEKLLAIGASTVNTAEAEVAMAKAQELMLEHNISMTQVEDALLNQTEFVDEEVWSGSQTSWDMPMVLSILENFFFVSPIRLISTSRWDNKRSTKIHFVGEKANVEIAKYAFIFLMRTFKELWTKYRQVSGAGLADCRVYYFGLEMGFSKKLREERDKWKEYHGKNEAGIIRINNQLSVMNEKLEEAFKNFHPSAHRERPEPLRGERSALEAGKLDGEKIQLNKPLPNANIQKNLT